MLRPRYHLLNEGCGNGPINIFFAGAGFNFKLAHDVGVRKRLLSWHANPKEEIDQAIRHDIEVGDTFLICDSGAFTAWNKGDEIDVEEYGERLLELLKYFDVAANLDVIPGKKGMPAKSITKEMTDRAAGDGWRNYLKLSDILSANGISPSRLMPIYHQGESMDWLKKMVDHGCDYIGISPSNDYRTSQRQIWLDDVFDYLASLPVMPKTHGYAVTAPVLMGQFAWYSVDSASWVQLGGYGCVNTPYGPVTMTDRKDIMSKPDSLHGRNWSKEMRLQLERYFDRLGLDIEKLKADYKERWKANAHYWLEIERSLKYKRRHRPEPIFGQIGEVPMTMHGQ